MKRFFAVLLAFVLLLSCAFLSSCKIDDPTPTNSPLPIKISITPAPDGYEPPVIDKVKNKIETPNLSYDEMKELVFDNISKEIPYSDDTEITPDYSLGEAVLYTRRGVWTTEKGKEIDKVYLVKNVTTDFEFSDSCDKYNIRSNRQTPSVGSFAVKNSFHEKYFDVLFENITFTKESSKSDAVLIAAVYGKTENLYFYDDLRARKTDESGTVYVSTQKVDSPFVFVLSLCYERVSDAASGSTEYVSDWFEAFDLSSEATIRYKGSYGKITLRDLMLFLKSETEASAIRYDVNKMILRPNEDYIELSLDSQPYRTYVITPDGSMTCFVLSNNIGVIMDSLEAYSIIAQSTMTFENAFDYELLKMLFEQA